LFLRGRHELVKETTLREMRDSDWPRVRDIYQEGIATGYATFETEVPTWERWDRSHVPACRLVAERRGVILGWAALSPVSDRCVYGGVGEVSVYVGKQAQGSGIGTRLLQELVKVSEKEGFWTLQAGIFPENSVSLQIHVRCGFRLIGRRERLGRLGGEWRDVLLLERRSSTVGAD
jgi:phosphinothricin acetyltransferase